MKERDLWARRDQWLKKHQPTLKSAVEASTLLDQVKEIAGKHNVLIEKPAIGAGDSAAGSSIGLRLVRNEKPVAAAPPLSFRRAAAGIVRGL